MNATLTALNGFLLALSWYAEQGITYTIQSSSDLTSWSTLPAVFSGSDTNETLTLESQPSPVFLRLRSNPNGDTNENGLPDTWEMQSFGYLDIDPQADPDQDGFSTFVEWVNGTDPLDYYNGQKVRMVLSSGRDWFVPAGGRSAQCVSLTVMNQSGRPLRGAPVRIRLQSGASGLLQLGDPLHAVENELIAYTDNLGRIHPAGHEIQFADTSGQPGEEVLIIEAGDASSEIRVHLVPDAGGGPPRQVRRSFLEDGSTRVTWKGPPGSAQAFRVEELMPSGTWSRILHLVSTEIPEPDPLTGVYAHTRTAP